MLAAEPAEMPPYHTPARPPTPFRPSNLEACAILDVALCSLRTAVDLVRTADSVSLRTAGIVTALHLTAGG